MPTGRKAFISSLEAVAYRDGAATTAGQVVVNDSIGGTAIAVISYNDNTVGRIFSVTPSGGHALTGGQVAAISDFDASTAGTNTFMEAVGIVEFDA